MADLGKINSSNSKLGKALVRIHDGKMSPEDEGTVIDRITKAILITLMWLFGAKPKKDYDDQLPKNSYATDFVSTLEISDKVISVAKNSDQKRTRSTATINRSKKIG